MEIVNRKLVTVAQLPDSFQFVSDSQDTEPIKRRIEGATKYDSFFVEIGDGEYNAVYGMVGVVPYLSKLCTKLT